MARSNKKVHLGDPEHLVSRDEAVDFLSAQLRFVPQDDSRQGLDRGFLDTTSNMLALEGSPKEVADSIANSVIERLEGNTNKFNKFTVEALALINKDFFTETLMSDEGRKADIIDQAVESLPLSNGKTFNAYDTIRVAKMIDIDFDKFAAHASTTRFPKSWMTVDSQARKVINPRGGAGLDAEVHEGFLRFSNTPEPLETVDEKSSFDSLTPDQKDFIVSIYNVTATSLNDAIEAADQLMDAKSEPQDVDFAESLVELNQADLKL